MIDSEGSSLFKGVSLTHTHTHTHTHTRTQTVLKPIIGNNDAHKSSSITSDTHTHTHTHFGEQQH